MLVALTLAAPVNADPCRVSYPDGQYPVPLCSLDTPVSNARTIAADAAAAELMPVPDPCPPAFYIAVLPPNILGVTQGCRSWLQPTVAGGGGWEGRVIGCSVVAHERFHQLGITYPTGAFVRANGSIDQYHAADPSSIMYPVLDGHFMWPCFERFAPRGSIRRWHTDHPDAAWATFP